MEKNNHRYVVNAVGKGGETYLTICQNKQELQKWLAEHEEDLIMEELQVIDKKRPFFKLFNLRR